MSPVGKGWQLRDRPVIVGAAYNGRGQDSSQANGTGATVGATTANAPAWFPGAAGDGHATADVENHAHQAVFSGFKTQALASSQSGQGGYNALVFDDTPDQAGTRLSTTQFTTALNLGRLKQQTDNQRQLNRGHGSELVTDAYGAVRAGSGLLITTDARAKGRWIDNVFVERIWKSVKYEHVYLHAYENVAEAKQQLATYFTFYNSRRPHSSLGGRTPDMTYFGEQHIPQAA